MPCPAANVSLAHQYTSPKIIQLRLLDLERLLEAVLPSHLLLRDVTIPVVLPIIGRRLLRLLLLVVLRLLILHALLLIVVWLVLHLVIGLSLAAAAAAAAAGVRHLEERVRRDGESRGETDRGGENETGDAAVRDWRRPAQLLSEKAKMKVTNLAKA